METKIKLPEGKKIEDKNRTKQIYRRQFVLPSIGLGAAAIIGNVLPNNPLGTVEPVFAEQNDNIVTEISKHTVMPVEVSGSYKRMNQKNTVWGRFGWDPKIMPIGQSFIGKATGAIPPSGEPGWTETDLALALAAWSVNDKAASLSQFGIPNSGLYSWDEPINQRKPGVNSPEAASDEIKKAASYLGASLVGIADYDERWVYSEFYHPLARKSSSADFPFKVKRVIVMAIEMNYEAVRTSPSLIASSAAALGYSHMAETAHKVATFVRQLGYHAIPCGNDTALSVPLAIQAGLGELGRNGILITPKYGPRVRLCKVFTDLPLKADQPITFGVQKFCESCKKCANECPSKAITQDTKPTMSGPTISNNPGARKWYINPEKCLAFWEKNGSDCGNCIASCPYNKLPEWHHELARAMTRTPAGPVLREMDTLFGFGKVYDKEAISGWWKK